MNERVNVEERWNPGLNLLSLQYLEIEEREETSKEEPQGGEGEGRSIWCYWSQEKREFPEGWSHQLRQIMLRWNPINKESWLYSFEIQRLYAALIIEVLMHFCEENWMELIKQCKVSGHSNNIPAMLSRPFSKGEQRNDNRNPYNQNIIILTCNQLSKILR